MKRPRLTVRWMMALVALVAILSGFVCLARVARYREKAAMFRTLAIGFRAQAAGTKSDPLLAAAYANDARHMEEVARKYDRAARSPWLPVEPDPPEPHAP